MDPPRNEFAQEPEFAAASSTRTARAHETASPVTLVWMDPEELLRFGFQAMADEVENAFEEAGVMVTWRKNVVTQDDDPLEIVITVRRSPPPEWRLGDHAMGTGFKVNDKRRVIYLFFDSVLRTLGFKYVEPRVPTATETMLLARALARVVSHEVDHSIAPGAPHAEDGLMQSQLTREGLRKPRLRLSEPSIRALSAALQEIDDAQKTAASKKRVKETQLLPFVESMKPAENALPEVIDVAGRRDGRGGSGAVSGEARR